MADVKTFSRRIRAIADHIYNNSQVVRKAAAREMLQELILSTPVDTGEARSNWRVGVNTVPLGIIPPYAPGEKLGIQETANAEAAISIGFSLINSSSDNAALVIVNNTRQIEFLNNGASSQTAGNFTARAINRAQKRVQRARLLKNG